MNNGRRRRQAEEFTEKGRGRRQEGAAEKRRGEHQQYGTEFCARRGSMPGSTANTTTTTTSPQPSSSPSLKLECDICLDTCHHATSTQCCQAQACRHCALSYILRNRSCWNCGTENIGKSNLTQNENIRDEIKRLKLKDVSSVIQCDLCSNIAQKGVRTSCCGGRACRSCARRFIIINRTCWSISCVGAASIDILQPDPALHLAVTAYNTSGDIDLECLKRLQVNSDSSNSQKKQQFGDGENNSLNGSLSNSSTRSNSIAASQDDTNTRGKQALDDIIDYKSESSMEEHSSGKATPQGDEGGGKKEHEDKNDEYEENSSAASNSLVNDVQKKKVTETGDAMELDSDVEVENENNTQESKNTNNDLSEVSDKDIVLLEDSDNDVQEIPEDGEILTDNDSQDKISSDNASVQSLAAAATKRHNEDDDSLSSDAASCQHNSKKQRKGSRSSSNSQAVEELEAEEEMDEGPLELMCMNLADVTININSRENFILLELLQSSDSSLATLLPPAPSSKLANKNVNLELTKEFTSLVSTHQDKYSCRVLSYNQHYFVLVNLKLDGGGRGTTRVQLPSRTCVAKCVVGEGTGEEQICINMTACVDLSVRQDIILQPANSAGGTPSYTPVKTYLKFQKDEHVSKRTVLELPFIISCCLICDIDIENRIFRANPCKYLAPHNVVSNDMQLDLTIRTKSGREILLCKNMMVCEVTSAENDQSIPKLLQIFGYKLEPLTGTRLNASTTNGEATSNGDAKKDGVEVIDEEAENKENVLNKGNNSLRNEKAKEEPPQELDEESKKKFYEKKMREGHEFFHKACYVSACKRYSEAIEVTGGSAMAYCWRSNSQFHLNNPTQALEDAVKSVELDPSLPEGCLSAIKASIADANIQKAREYMDALEKLIPESDEKEGLEAQLQEAEDKVSNLETMETEIIRCMEAKEYKKALDTVKDCLHHCKFSQRYKIIKAEILALVGGFEESNRIINEVKGFGSNPDCLYVKAIGQYFKDNLDLASHFLKDVFNVNSEHKKSRSLQDKIDRHKEANESVQSAMKLDSLETALQKCEEALKVDEENKNLQSRLYHLKGRVYSKHEKHIEAMEEYTTAISLNSQNSKAYFSRAKSYLSLSLLDDALKDAEVIIRHESGNAHFRQLYSQVKSQYDEYKNSDFYKLLGVEKTSSQEEIKKAYRKAALVHHPDRHSSKHEKIQAFHERRFKDIGEAYGILSDEPKKLLYDKGLLNRSIPTPGAQPQAQPHFTNISNVAMQNAAFWASVVQQQRQAAGLGTAAAGSGLAGARPGAAAAGFGGAARAANAAAGLAGASPFLFVPQGGAAAGAANFAQYNLYRNAAQFANLSQQFRFQQQFGGQNPYGKF